jgi:hypothetical protein
VQIKFRRNCRSRVWESEEKAFSQKSEKSKERRRPYLAKYTPAKYRRRVTPKARRPVYSGKRIAVYRSARTRRHPRPYSARFEFYGIGQDLAKAIRLALSGVVPRFEDPYVACSARAFLSDPYRFGERGEWVDRPKIES